MGSDDGVVRIAGRLDYSLVRNSTYYKTAAAAVVVVVVVVEEFRRWTKTRSPVILSIRLQACSYYAKAHT
jgi:hypothetical protein